MSWRRSSQTSQPNRQAGLKDDLPLLAMAFPPISGHLGIVYWRQGRARHQGFNRFCLCFSRRLRLDSSTVWSTVNTLESTDKTDTRASHTGPRKTASPRTWRQPHTRS